MNLKVGILVSKFFAKPLGQRGNKVNKSTNQIYQEFTLFPNRPAWRKAGNKFWYDQFKTITPTAGSGFEQIGPFQESLKGRNVNML
jgi:hypothetical protein